jgi:hypothetical protein
MMLGSTLSTNHPGEVSPVIPAAASGRDVRLRSTPPGSASAASIGNPELTGVASALGHLEVRKVRGPILDQLYAQLKRCGDLSCSGKPFAEHRNIPVLVLNPRDRRPAWQQITEKLTEAIQSGSLALATNCPRSPS